MEDVVGTSLVVEWLGLSASSAGGALDQRTKILQAMG